MYVSTWIQGCKQCSGRKMMRVNETEAGFRLRPFPVTDGRQRYHKEDGCESWVFSSWPERH